MGGEADLRGDARGPPALLFRPAVFLLSFSPLRSRRRVAADNHAGSTQVDSQALPATRTDSDAERGWQGGSRGAEPATQQELSPACRSFATGFDAAAVEPRWASSCTLCVGDAGILRHAREHRNDRTFLRWMEKEMLRGGPGAVHSRKGSSRRGWTWQIHTTGLQQFH